MSWNPFKPPSRPEAQWSCVGLASSFPDLGLDHDDSSPPPPCRSTLRAGGKLFQMPSMSEPHPSGVLRKVDADDDAGLQHELLVFQYKGKFHAVDHQCPHEAFPLSHGELFDIEDFGIVLSAGLTCSRHGWSFDLFTGKADRGSYELKVWEVQLREPSVARQELPTDETQGALHGADKEVWVRRKQKAG
ncbi:hypothetical protein RJ55_04323 [Drechmeria coniospora]|nr:hypothetical protein RJ55_04323 [Drechmeria coniospora]